MATPLENAERRLAALRQEIERVERFIRDYHEFAGGQGRHPSDIKSATPTGGNGSEPQEIKPVEKWDGRAKMRPDDIAVAAEQVIREIGEPLTRGQIVDALENRGVPLPAVDKARYVGTILWRHKGAFVNVTGRGYWLRGQPVPLTPEERAEVDDEVAPDDRFDDSLPF